MAPRKKTIVMRATNPSSQGSFLSQASKWSWMLSSMTHGHHQRAPDAILEEPKEQIEQQQPPKGAFVAHAPHDNPRKTPHADYSIVDHRQLTKAQDENHFEEGKRNKDPPFWCHFHADWYRSVILTKKTSVVQMKSINWNYMRNKNHPLFNEIIAAYECYKIYEIMGFNYPWNDEIIMHFYATLYLPHRSGVIEWMTNGLRYSSTLKVFAQHLHLQAHFQHRQNLHDGDPMVFAQMKHFYLPGQATNAPTITSATPDVILLHRMLRVTLASWIEDASSIPSYERNLIDAIKKQEPFNIFDYILQEIWNVAVTPSQACAYAPFIMSFIEHVFGLSFVKDVHHMDLKPQLPSSTNLFRQTPPPPPSTTSALSSSYGPGSSKGCSDIFMLFKGLVSMCQRTNLHLDIIQKKLDANAYKHRLIHSKMQIKEPLREVLTVEILSEPIDPFAFLTPDELNYFEMGEYHLCGAPRGSDDNGSDGDYEDNNDDEATK
jgi:hypothetical protein